MGHHIKGHSVLNASMVHYQVQSWAVAGNHETDVGNEHTHHYATSLLISVASIPTYSVGVVILTASFGVKCCGLISTYHVIGADG